MEEAFIRVIEEFVNMFAKDSDGILVKDPDEIRRVVTETCEKFEDEYYEIVNVDEDDFDKGELEYLYKEMEREIVNSLRLNDLL